MQQFILLSKLNTYNVIFCAFVSLPPLTSQREAASSSAPQEPEQNSIMGKLDEGLDDFFSKKVTRLNFK